MTSLSIVIPAYNEEKRLPASLDLVVAYLAQASYSFAEVIVVDDGSKDSTAAVVEQDNRVGRFAKLKGAFVSEFGPERTGDNSRRIGLRYARVLKGRLSSVLARAVVDLSGRKLVDFEETPAEDARR